MQAERKFTLLSCFLIAILGFLVYANSINGKFIWDDEFLIKENSYIKAVTLSNVKNIFTHNIGAGAGRVFEPYRPFQIFSYMIDYQLWGSEVIGYHFTNILLHILTALSMYWLITLLFGNRFLSLITGILFVVHPIHTEAVAYISGRADPLAMLFMFLCLIFYIKYNNAPKVKFYILMIISYIIAVFSRELSLILPFAVLLYHYVFKKKIKLNSFLPLIVVILLYLLARYFVLKPFTFGHHQEGTVFQRVPGFFAALAEYIRLLFLPFSLHMGYGAKLFAFTNLKVIIGVIILSSLVTYIFKIGKNNKLYLFAIGWFFVTLIPQSNIIFPVSAYMGEHWLYMPSLGFFLILSNVIFNLCSRHAARIFMSIIIVGLVLFYASLTVKQNKYWDNEVTFYERTLKYVPDNAKLFINTGNVYRGIGRYEDAINMYKKAIEIDRSSAIAYFNLAEVYSDLGKGQEAEALYKKAIELKPSLRNYLNQ